MEAPKELAAAAGPASARLAAALHSTGRTLRGQAVALREAPRELRLTYVMKWLVGPIRFFFAHPAPPSSWACASVCPRRTGWQ